MLLYNSVYTLYIFYIWIYFPCALLFSIFVFWKCNQCIKHVKCCLWMKKHLMFCIQNPFTGFSMQNIRWVDAVNHIITSDSLLLTLPGEPWPQYMFGGVWLEPVHHRAWPEGGVFTLWSSGRGQCGVRPAHRSLPGLCLCLLWETWGF